MKTFSLNEYVKKHGQTKTALLLGVSQGAVWQMLHSDRNISIEQLPDGSISAYETKLIGKPKTAA